MLSFHRYHNYVQIYSLSHTLLRFLHVHMLLLLSSHQSRNYLLSHEVHMPVRRYKPHRHHNLPQPLKLQDCLPEQAVPLYDLSFIQSSFQFLFIFFHSVISYTNRPYSYVDYLQHSSFRTDRLIPSPIFKIAVSSRSSCFNSYRYSRILA